MTDSDRTSAPRPASQGLDERATRAAAKIALILARQRLEPAAVSGRGRPSALLGLRPLGLMTDAERADATGYADPAFEVRESITMLDALDALTQRLHGAAGVVSLIAQRAGAEGDRLTSGAAAAAGAQLDEAAALLRVIDRGIVKHDASEGGAS